MWKKERCLFPVFIWATAYSYRHASAASRYIYNTHHDGRTENCNEPLLLNTFWLCGSGPTEQSHIETWSHQSGLDWITDRMSAQHVAIPTKNILTEPLWLVVFQHHFTLHCYQIISSEADGLTIAPCSIILQWWHFHPPSEPSPSPLKLPLNTRGLLHFHSFVITKYEFVSSICPAYSGDG